MNEDIPKCIHREILSDLGQKLTRYFKIVHNAKFGLENFHFKFCETIQSDSEHTDYCKYGYIDPQTLFTMLITSLNETFGISLARSIWEH